MAPGLNDNCWCGKGRKYRDCHADIDRVAPDRKYSASHAVYARNWTSISRSHFRNGVYDWMASLLKEQAPRRVLDIGCGSGHGLVAMHQVLGGALDEMVAIDENRECLRVAGNTLRGKLGVHADVVTRMSVSVQGGGYVHRAQPLTIDSKRPCVLIEADVCNDPYLRPALQSMGPFDAVTVWLTGVHMLRQDNVEIPRHAVRSEGDHREYVQSKSYALADAVLKPGGVMQVCDRIVSTHADGIKVKLKSHHERLSSATSMRIESMAHRNYEEPETGKIALRLTRMAGSSRQPGGEFGLISVVSRKT